MPLSQSPSRSWADLGDFLSLCERGTRLLCDRRSNGQAGERGASDFDHTWVGRMSLARYGVWDLIGP
jgi:hypothetical protein